MATAPHKQVSCRLAAVALACVAQAGFSGRPAAAQPPSFRFIHAAAVAAHAASIAQRAATERVQPHEEERVPLHDEEHAQAHEAEGARAQPESNASAAAASLESPPTSDHGRASVETPAARAEEQVTPPVHGEARTPAAAPARARAPNAPKQPPPLPSILERLGGEHAKRAMQVAQGVPAGRVALRPMFWMTRDQRGGMVALGGRF